MEEITAKEQMLQEHFAAVSSRDMSLQKHVKAHGSLTPHPREAAYNESVIQNLDRCQTLQDEKIALADRSSVLLDRQLKRLDVKIRDLQKEGLLSDDPPLPSLLNPESSARRTESASASAFREPLRFPHPALLNGGAGHNAAATLGRNASSAVYASSPNNAQYALASRFNNNNNSNSGGNSSATAARTASMPGNMGSSQDRVLSPLNPAAAAAAMQYQRHHQQMPSEALVAAAGGMGGVAGLTAPDAKRRRLHSFSAATPKSSYPSLSLTPSQASGASPAIASMGGFGGAATPSAVAGSGGGTAGGAGRSGSVSSGGRNTLVIKKTAGKKVAPHQQAGRRGSSTSNSKTAASAAAAAKAAKAKRNKKRAVHGGGRISTSTAAGKRNSTSPYYVEEDDDDDDSGLSSPAPSDIDHYLAAEHSDGENDNDDDDDGEDDGDEDEGNEDLKVYCTCQTVSHGDMVACDNDDCPHEWFHWKCVGLTREPIGAWYCDECRQRLGK